MKDFKKLASDVIQNVGGKENVTDSWHCVTRLRFNVHDKDKVNMSEIKKIAGVMGAQFSGEQFQVIIGNDVSKAFDEVKNQLGSLPTEEKSTDEKGNIVGRLMDVISGIFTPALPALVGTGLLKGFLALFLALGWVSATSSGYNILNMVSDCAFYFLPFLLAVSSAKKFKTNEYLALCIAGVLLYPTMVNGYNELAAGGSATGFQLFGFLPVPFLAYSSSVIPIILAVWCLAHVYKWVKKIMPSVLTTMFTPMITLLIVVPLTLIVFGPIGTYMGAILANGLMWLFNHVGILAAALVGSCYPLLVMTGMHWALMPIMLAGFANLGYDASLAPAMLAATFGMAGATFGVFFKSRSEGMKQLSLSSGISAVLGITEPAMYGVTLKLKRPFYAAMIGGGIAGMVMNFFTVKSFGMAMPGLIALAGYVDPNSGTNIVIAVIGSLIAFVVALICVYLLGFTEEKDDQASTQTVSLNEGSQIKVQSPVAGHIIPVESLSDQTFAQEIMGKTIAIDPVDGQILAPVDGTVEMVASSKHAIGIRSNEGLEILLHLGIDTVELKGEGFELQINEGDTVKSGTPLMKENIQFIKEAGYNPVVLMIFTNSADFLDVLPTYKSEDVTSGSELSIAVN